MWSWFSRKMTVLIACSCGYSPLIDKFYDRIWCWMDVSAQQLRQHAAQPYQWGEGFYLIFTSQCKQSVSLSLSKWGGRCHLVRGKGEVNWGICADHLVYSVIDKHRSFLFAFDFHSVINESSEHGLLTMPFPVPMFHIYLELQLSDCHN